MSDRKKCFIFAMLMILFLSACTGGYEREDSALGLAIESGILISPENIPAEETVNLFEVFLGQLEQTFPLNVRTYFPVSRTLSFDNIPYFMVEDLHSYGRFAGVYVEAGQVVSAGDVLSEVLLDYMDEMAEISRLDLEARKHHFIEDFERENMRRLVEIDRLRNNVYFAQDDEFVILSLRLASNELRHQQFLAEANLRRADYERRIQELSAMMYGVQIYAPFDGIISFANNAAEGMLWRDIPAVTHAGERGIVSIVSPDSVQFIAYAGINVLRYGDIILLREHAGTLSFDVRVASDPLARPIAREGSHEFVLVPANMADFDRALEANGMDRLDLPNIPLRIYPQVLIADNAVITHRQTIHQENRRNYVFVYDAGNIRKRYVDVGPVFGNYVQILTGLAPGQLLVRP